MTKTLYLVAGPNGSGKTTMAKELIREDKITFLNADEIAARCRDNIGIRAGRILLEKLDCILDNGESVVLESTVSGNYHEQIIKRAKKLKYQVVFMYVFLASVEQNLKRIKQRVALGGHNVPPVDVRRRYSRSLKNFSEIIPMVDQWELYYNGENSYEIVARGKDEIVEILDDALYNHFKKEAK